MTRRTGRFHGILQVDRYRKFDPVEFCRMSACRIVWQDKRSLALEEIDFSRVAFESLIESMEGVVRGEKKLARIKADGRIALDAAVGQALLEEDGQKILRSFSRCSDQSVTRFELAGTVLEWGRNRFLISLEEDRHDHSWGWWPNLLSENRDVWEYVPLLSLSTRKAR